MTHYKKHNKIYNTNILLNTDYSQDVAVPQVHRDTNSASAPQYEKPIMITVNVTASPYNDDVTEMRYYIIIYNKLTNKETHTQQG